MVRESRVRNALALAGALTLAALSAAGIADATAPTKGGIYMARLEAKVFVSFKVSASGKKVTNLGAGTAVECKGSAGGFPSAKPGSAPITRNGTFRAVLKLYPPGPAGQKSSGTDTVTGKFVKGDKAVGTVTTHFNGQNSSSFCQGITRSYTAFRVARGVGL